MAFVFFVISFFILSTQIHKLSLSISAKTTFAPVYFTALAVATNVKSGTITSSPLEIPNAAKAKCKAVVPFDVVRANLVSQYFANFFSKVSMYSPIDDTHPDSNALRTYSFSFLPI